MADLKPSWYYRPWFVLLMLFFVLGPFGLPLAYKSPCFSKPWKIILTIAVIAFTVYLIITSYGMAKIILERFYNAGSVK